MRFFLIIALVLINLAPLLSQQFEEFTSYEINLIQSGNENDLMRVFNLSSAEDSIILKSTSIDISPTHPLTQLLAKRMLETVQNPEHLGVGIARSEEHTSELQSRGHLVCLPLLEKNKNHRQ